MENKIKVHFSIFLLFILYTLPINLENLLNNYKLIICVNHFFLFLFFLIFLFSFISLLTVYISHLKTHSFILIFFSLKVLIVYQNLNAFNNKRSQGNNYLRIILLSRVGMHALRKADNESMTINHAVL